MNLFKKTPVQDLTEREEQKKIAMEIMAQKQAYAVAAQQQAYSNQVYGLQGQAQAQGLQNYGQQNMFQPGQWTQTTTTNRPDPYQGHTLEFIVDMIIAKVEGTVAEQVREIVREELQNALSKTKTDEQPAVLAQPTECG